MNIYQKMAAITAELRTVAKNLTVQQTKTSSYKAVSERDILDAVKPLEEKYGVYSYPCGRRILESNLLESESEFQGKTTKKTTFMTRIETTYRFVNIENPDEFMETVTFAEGIDTQDKGSGKAMTYADKYALMKGYKISTGDDPDQTASEETGYSVSKSKAHYEEEANKQIEKLQVQIISGLIEKSGSNGSDILKYVNKTYGKNYSAIAELTQREYVDVVKILNKKLEKKEG
ncbi:MAG: ERF family protein [Clostridia bacterium]|nr:ERF family protein [Clostridia bacterium]